MKCEIKDEMEIDFKTPLMTLEFLLNHFDANNGIPMMLQIGDALPVWEKVSASSPLNLDDLEIFSADSRPFFSAALLGHGIMSNFFHFDFLSSRLKVAVAFPYGNVMTDDAISQKHAQNARSIIAALYLIFNAFAKKHLSFLPEKGMLLAVCQDFRTSFRVRDDAGIVREEQNWQGLLDLLTEDNETKERFCRIYV